MRLKGGAPTLTQKEVSRKLRKAFGAATTAGVQARPAPHQP
jgi:hypothetical protein